MAPLFRVENRFFFSDTSTWPLLYQIPDICICLVRGRCPRINPVICKHPPPLVWAPHPTPAPASPTRLRNTVCPPPTILYCIILLFLIYTMLYSIGIGNTIVLVNDNWQYRVKAKPRPIRNPIPKKQKHLKIHGEFRPNLSRSERCERCSATQRGSQAAHTQNVLCE